MGCLEVCPTEDAIGAFLEYLVNPLLPLKKFSNNGIPSLAEQESVAQQLHGVVILYNYYHRRRHSHLQFLGFEGFCKLTIIMNRALLPHMQYIQKYDQIKLDALDKQLSVCEKRIMIACEICTELDGSKGNPVTEGWPILKVAVFLVDSTKKNCFLLLNSITQGVWSLIEKDVESLENVSEGKQLLKKRRITKRTYRDDSGVDEDHVLQLAFLSLKEATGMIFCDICEGILHRRAYSTVFALRFSNSFGDVYSSINMGISCQLKPCFRFSVHEEGISQDDLSVLETHTVYSMSKERSSCRLYIIQSGQTSGGTANQVPIGDFIGSLQGPLVQKISDGWVVTQVVEYLNLLPYADILSDWFSREALTITLYDVKLNAEANIQGKIKTVEKESQNMQVNNLTEIDVITEKSDAGESVIENNVERASIEIKAKDNSTNVRKAVSETMQRHEADSVFEEASVESEIQKAEADPGIDEREKALVLHDGDSSQNGALVACQPNLQLLNDLQSILSSKDSPISQATWKILLRKRTKLSLQLRDIVDQIALCDKSIQAFLNGGADAITLKLQVMLDACNDMLLKIDADERISKVPQQCWPQSAESDGLREASLNGQNSCRSLDEICNRNAWILPTYHISIVNGGFVADVTVKGMDFERFFTGKQCCTPQDARDSAADHALLEMRAMAS